MRSLLVLVLLLAAAPGCCCTPGGTLPPLPAPPCRPDSTSGYRRPCYPAYRPIDSAATP
jgi:hypothetical protein